MQSAEWIYYSPSTFCYTYKFVVFNSRANLVSGGSIWRIHMAISLAVSCDIDSINVLYS